MINKLKSGAASVVKMTITRVQMILSPKFVHRTVQSSFGLGRSGQECSQRTNWDITSAPSIIPI